MTTLDGLRAHWLRPDLIALPQGWGTVEEPARLVVSVPVPESSGESSAADDDEHLLGREPARDGELPAHLRRAGLEAWTTPVERDGARAAVRARLEVRLPDGRATGVQLALLLDELFAGAGAADAGPFGASVDDDGRVTLRLWAPTAVDVAVEVLDVVDAVTGAVRVVRLQRALPEARTGIWTVPPDPAGPSPAITVGVAYRWVVTVYAPSTGHLEVNRVTDPYAHALTVNATAGVVVDLTDPELEPAQWRDTPAPRPARAVDHLITELHVRDLSRDALELPDAERGTYRAFTRDIPGTRHLRLLADAGLTTVHLLPVYDIATVEEDRTRRPDAAAVAHPAVLAAAAPDSDVQQRLVGEANAVARTFNWGYDPLHVLAPEGSYAVEAHGAARCTEVREMVGALHGMGLAVVLDQVYNHTHACGQDPTSVLCRIVPAYYSRLSVDGAVETSTCCPNVATEHAMVQRWMVDACVHWVRAYRVDGFRFDLMGHHSRETMLAVREALDALTVARDGVDGRGVLLYGEGWNFGEVADDALFIQARQGNLGGTGIATFSDRLRDAVTGGTPSDRATLARRGLATGLVDDAAAGVPGAAEEVGRLSDLVRLGLAGNLRGVRFLGHDGVARRGDEIGYAGQAAGYGQEPEEVLTYVDAHDNETLYDAFTLKLPTTTPMAERVRRNTLALAAVAWSQTAGLWHAGTELLRSKSLDTDSYDSGDWFNRIDWDGLVSTFGSGLPPHDANGESWDVLRPLLADPALRPDAGAMAAAREAALDLLRVRAAVPLLRLGSAGLVGEKVTFPGAGPGSVPGLVAVLVDDAVGEPAAGPSGPLDPAHRAALVALNFSRESVRVRAEPLVGRSLELAAPLACSSDPAFAEVDWFVAAGTLVVPPLTAVVMVERR